MLEESFTVFSPIHKTLFHKIFRTEASAKVSSRELREIQTISDIASKNDLKYRKIRKKISFLFMVSSHSQKPHFAHN